jgi:transmembrane sensor
MQTSFTYDRLAELAYQKITGGLTDVEATELANIIESCPDKKKFFEELMDPDTMAEVITLMSESEVKASWERVKEKYPFPPKRRRRGIYVIAAAVIALTIGCVSIYLIRNENNKPTAAVNETQSSPNPTITAETIATINKPDGSVIIINQGQSGIIDSIGSEPLEMKGDALIVPSIALARKGKATVIKTLAGRDLNIQLTDGSKVSMYGNSSLSFPADFTPEKRTVMLQGEAFFDLAKNELPFTVQVREIEIEVLSSEFNVDAYKERGPVTTSVFTGKARLKSSSGETIEIMSREEGQFSKNKFRKKILPKYCENKVLGKKMGMFVFEDINAKTVLEDIAQHYDCDVAYNGQMPTRLYSANFPRNMELNMLLQNLFKDWSLGLSLRGKTIVVDFPKARR